MIKLISSNVSPEFTLSNKYISKSSNNNENNIVDKPYLVLNQQSIKKVNVRETISDLSPDFGIHISY